MVYDFCGFLFWIELGKGDGIIVISVGMNFIFFFESSFRGGDMKFGWRGIVGG